MVKTSNKMTVTMDFVKTAKGITSNINIKGNGGGPFNRIELYGSIIQCLSALIINDAKGVDKESIKELKTAIAQAFIDHDVAIEEIIDNNGKR